MALRADRIDISRAESTTEIDAPGARAYAAATNDHNPAYFSGPGGEGLVPPLYGVVPTWQPFLSVAQDVIPADAFAKVVHLAQDMRFHRPLEVGQKLVTTAKPYSVRVSFAGTRLTILVTSCDPDGEAVLDQYATLFVRGMADGDNAGPEAPAHAFARAGRPEALGEVTAHVDDDQTYRYRDASGDEMPIHVDEEFARNVGLPGIIVHGLCTMAICSQAVVNIAAGGDPAALRRMAVRFARPVFPGADVTTTVFADVGDGSAAGHSGHPFEATSGGKVVIKDGRAEVRS